MTYEQLIIAVDDIAPDISNIAYKLLWRLIALAMQRGTPVVSFSQRQMAVDLRRSKESIANGSRELALHIPVTPGDGQNTRYSLPAEWFPPQRTLFSEDQLGGLIHNRPGNQATSGLETGSLPAWKPGHQRPGNQATWVGNQATSGLETGSPGLETRPLWPGNQATSGVFPIRNAYARNRSIESESSALSEVVVIIDRAWACVEIPGDKEAAAALLSEELYAYQRDLGPMRADSVYPDSVIVARILALAPYDTTARVLRTLREKGKTGPDQYAWFFTVIAQKVYGASSQLTHSRMAAGKPKARPYESKPSLFGDQLVEGVASAIRKIG